MTGRPPGSKDRQPRRRTPTVTTPAKVAEIVEAAAQGKTQAQVAAEAGVGLNTVARTLAEHRDEIARRAAQIFNESLAKLQGQSVVGKVIDRVDRAAQSGTAQELDQTSRALHALARFTGQATGADESGARGGKVTVEIRLPDWSQPRERVIDATATRILPPGQSEVRWPPRDPLDDPEDPQRHLKLEQRRRS
jgi:hypothetical protein